MKNKGLMTNYEALEDFYDNYRQDYQHKLNDLPSRRELHLMNIYDHYFNDPYYKEEEFDPLYDYYDTVQENQKNRQLIINERANPSEVMGRIDSDWKGCSEILTIKKVILDVDWSVECEVTPFAYYEVSKKVISRVVFDTSTTRQLQLMHDFLIPKVKIKLWMIPRKEILWISDNEIEVKNYKILGMESDK